MKLEKFSLRAGGVSQVVDSLHNKLEDHEFSQYFQKKEKEKKKFSPTPTFLVLSMISLNNF
jgi:hypothetical protein